LVESSKSAHTLRPESDVSAQQLLDVQGARVHFESSIFCNRPCGFGSIPRQFYTVSIRVPKVKSFAHSVVTSAAKGDPASTRRRKAWQALSASDSEWQSGTARLYLMGAVILPCFPRYSTRCDGDSRPQKGRRPHRSSAASNRNQLRRNKIPVHD
jgi:hypothetical protein